MQALVVSARRGLAELSAGVSVRAELTHCLFRSPCVIDGRHAAPVWLRPTGSPAGARIGWPGVPPSAIADCLWCGIVPSDLGRLRSHAAGCPAARPARCWRPPAPAAANIRTVDRQMGTCSGPAAAMRRLQPAGGQRRRG